MRLSRPNRNPVSGHNRFLIRRKAFRTRLVIINDHHDGCISGPEPEWEIRMRVHCYFLAVILLLAPVVFTVRAADTGHTIMKRGVIHEDLYLAGSEIRVQARVEGDLLAAGGEIHTLDTVRGDAMLAGGTVRIRGTVADDVRTVGGDVEVAAHVGDDLLAAGGSVTVPAGSTVGGRAWLAGNTVTCRARVAKGVRIAANRIVLGGEIDGDVELYGEQIIIDPGTVILGNLTYWSPAMLSLDRSVRVDGIVTHRAAEVSSGEPVSGGAGMRLGLFTTLAVTAVAFALMFPNFTARATTTLVARPWHSLGLGVALLTATPLVVFLLWASLLGLWLGFVLLALYLVLLLVGQLTAGLAIAEQIRRLPRFAGPERRRRIAAILIAFFLLWLLCLIPVAGALAMFALMLFGMGAIVLTLWDRYRQPS